MVEEVSPRVPAADVAATKARVPALLLKNQRLQVLIHQVGVRHHPPSDDGGERLHHVERCSHRATSWTTWISRASLKGPGRLRWFPCTCCSSPWQSGPAPRSSRRGRRGGWQRSRCWRSQRQSTP